MAVGDTSPDTPAAIASPIGQRAARGMAWLLFQTFATRVVSLGSQIVLATLLLEEDFGTWALAFSAYNIALIVQQGGLAEVLTRRHAEFNRLANAATWFSMALSITAAAGLVAAGWALELAYHKPGVLALCAVLAPSLLFMAPMKIADTRLRIQMRFRFVAVANTVVMIALMGSTCALAWWGWGAMSFALARPLSELLHLLLFQAAARTPLRPNPQFGLWRDLFADNSLVLASKAVLTVMQQADRLVLGAFASAATLGVYFFAYQLTFQSMQLFTGNLVSVLLPALSKLNSEPKRMLAGFNRACRLLAVVSVPVAFLQAVAAEPAIRLVFPDRWTASIPIIQILSVGIGFRVVGSPAGSLMYAAGRYRAMLVLHTVYTAVFFLMLVVGAIAGGLLGLSIAASLFFGLLGPVHMYVAIRPLGGTAADVFRVYAVPVATGAAGAAAAWATARMIPPHTPWREVVQLAAIGLVGLGVAAGLTALLAPANLRELADVALKVVRRTPAKAAVPTTG